MVDKITTHQAEDDARNQDILIYVNGALKPRSAAMVSVYDSGFMLGDGVWEGLRLYNGTWAFLDEHLGRLQEAAKAIDLDMGMTVEEIKKALLDTQKANNMITDAHALSLIHISEPTRPY